MLKLIAACAFGLEALVKRELQALGYSPRTQRPGRVEFEGDWQAVCEANLWLRTADRVLIEVLDFSAPDFDALFETIKQHDWAALIPAEAQFPVMAKSRHSQLSSVPAIQRASKKALVEALQRDHGVNELPETGAVYRVEVALLNDQASVTIDTTGDSLHKRGYRKLVGPAPLKETLAAALVSLSVWRSDRPLVDPFCGSGTIPIEAALIGRNIAPGLHREFASSSWSSISQLQWREVREAAKSQQQNATPLQIIGTDRDPEVLSLARYHLKQAGVEDTVHLQEKAFDQLRSKREYGCVVTNPPYGERLDEQRRLRGLYESIPMVMQRLPTWSLFVLTSMPRFEKLVQRKATRRRKLFNGRIECTYFQFLGPKPAALQRSDRVDVDGDRGSEDVPQPSQETEGKAPGGPKMDRSSSSLKATPVFGGLEAKDHEQAQLFEQRLVKRARHFRRWPKRGITCFRLYDRDIPEIPLVVDRYEDCLHLTEYERPHERDLARHAAWLELMKKTAASTLEVPIQKVFLKQRRKNEQSGQYEKLDNQKHRMSVSENGLSFLVNLVDYVDTGLFLDHRNTRGMVRDRAAGKNVLNLFAYTGSFSVYAAAGGAASTTTVDLSKNYLQWAEANFRANDLLAPQHQFIQADSLEFLEQAKRHGWRYDLAIVDPPTYSNSKRLESDWDVQSDHVRLLNAVGDVLTPGGEIYFSTNFRRFKLDEGQLTRFEIREISQQTVPEDFRNQRIHRCWWMKHL